MNSKKQILLCFIGIYIFVYTFPFPLGDIPGTAYFTQKLTQLHAIIIPWIGKNIFNISSEIKVFYSGSADRLYHYLMLFVNLSITFLATLLCLAFRKRLPPSNIILRWLLVYTQFYLGAMMLYFGMIKLIMFQFTEPTFELLIEPLGMLSPMELAWNFYGISKAFNVFSGSIEIMAGFLLFYRRTRLMGAMLNVSIMLNVFVINLLYDVPVKLYALHILMMSLFLLTPDIKRLVSLFVFNKSVEKQVFEPYFKTKKNNQLFRYLRHLLVLLMCSNTVYIALRDQKLWGDYAPKPPLYGLYEVDSFEWKGKQLPPNLNDDTRWHYLVFEKADKLDVYGMDRKKISYACVVDTLNRQIKIKEAAQHKDDFILHYRATNSTMYFEGFFRGERIRLKTTHRNKTDFPLLNRGFHLIQEKPHRRY